MYFSASIVFVRLSINPCFFASLKAWSKDMGCGLAAFFFVITTQISWYFSLFSSKNRLSSETFFGSKVIYATILIPFLRAYLSPM
jgi:hypothetical protein